MELSVMFFGSESTLPPSDKYDDILAIAQAADALGFKAVWTPERHFQDFGQVFPNPSVIGAALAVATRNIEIRAGSVVLPLHRPLRVAEEWAVIDNLSKGRIGVSVATGWHTKDFVLAPHRYADRRSHTLHDVDLLRAHWSGRDVECTDGVGETVPVRPQPTPYSSHLPLWLTTSGNPDTWIAAGERRMGVLAPGPSVAGHAKLAKNIRAYRAAHDAAPPQPATTRPGLVTVMMHAYAAATDATARAHVREPLRGYLSSYLRQTTGSKDPAGPGSVKNDPATLHRMTDFALEQHLHGGSLIGSPRHCRETLATLAETGVDEVACFVDFGLPREDILRSLTLLGEIRRDLTRRAA